MTDTGPDEILAIARASAGRRVLGLCSLVLLGGLLVYVALSQSPEPVWRVFLILVGLGALWLADRMRRATMGQIELTETALRDSDGTVIAELADIRGVDRGAFAFKPSNGFMLRTERANERDWRPGLWWRMGRRIGIGGMTPGHQTKVMSEIIAAQLAQREMDGER